MPQAELARRTGRPTQAINEIANGEKAITPETAIQLEQVVGVPAHIWTSLESEFQLVKARQRDNDSLDREVALASEYPYNELSKQEFVPKTRKRLERVRELRRFFGVASLTFVERLDVYKAAFRTKMTARKLRAVRVAWLRVGALMAGEIEVKPFDRRELKNIVPELRRLTMANAGQLAGELRSIFARSGIAFVLMRHFKSSGVNGATFWLSQDKAVLMMSIPLRAKMLRSSPASWPARKLRAVRVAWLRVGALMAGEIEVKPFDRRELKNIVPELRRLTMANAGQLAGELRSIFARSGIAFVLMRHFKSSGVNGATFWLSQDKAVLMMSIRGRWADIFWFTLFHEVGHILLHGKRAIFVDTDRNQEPDGDWMVQEEEANQFARNTLIPPRAFSRFIETEDFSMDAIREFSESVEIHPGIVVGRLKNDKNLKPYEMNEMRYRYQWADNPK